MASFLGRSFGYKCKTFLGLLFSVALMTCAAKLPQEVTVKRPLAESKPFDASIIKLKRLSDEAPVSLDQYMTDNNLKYLVLTFGSQGCAVCMQKARYLQTNLVQNDYKLLGSAAKDVVELLGVITDPVESRDDVLSLIGQEGLSHVELWDPGHDVMMKFFQPEGRSFSVPLTVMVSKNEILWRVPSWEAIDGPTLIKKIGATLGVDANPPPVNPDPPDGGVSQSLLSIETSNRFDDVRLSSCGDRTEVNLGNLLPYETYNYRGVLLTTKSCADDPSCNDARSALRTWQEECHNRWGKTCVVKEIVTDQSLCGGQDETLIGGKEFFSVFSDHFNWSYAPIETAPGRWKLPDTSGPLALIFDGLGRLVYSKEGSIGSSLRDRMDNDKLANREAGPDFGIFLSQQFSSVRDLSVESVLPSTFSNLRQSSKYTLVVFWNTWCGSCFEELEDLHRRVDSAYNFCRQDPEFCKVVALETGRSETELEPPTYLSGLINGNEDFEGWLKKGWTMPLAVEDFPRQDGKAPLGWYDGWFRARFGTKEPRNVLYDREGKVLGAWLGLPGEHGPERALRKLHNQNQKGR